MRQHHLFLAPGGHGGEEKAGFGAQPRVFDTILPCPGDISNNIGHVGASNFKMLLRSPIPKLILASGRPSRGVCPKAGRGGLGTEKVPGYSFICVYLERTVADKQSALPTRSFQSAVQDPESPNRVILFKGNFLSLGPSLSSEGKEQKPLNPYAPTYPQMHANTP